jgi:hypothetical protein
MFVKSKPYNPVEVIKRVCNPKIKKECLQKPEPEQLEKNAIVIEMMIEINEKVIVSGVIPLNLCQPSCPDTQPSDSVRTTRGANVRHDRTYSA